MVKYHFIKAYLALAAVAIIGSLSILPTTTRAEATEPGAAATGPAQPDLAALDGYIEQALSDWQTPGLALGVVKDGRLLYAKGYGVRDIASKEPVTAETLFPIGSCTKAFTATMLAMLVDDGKLAWDAPVRQALPQFALQDEWASGHLTLRDLLRHASGLPRHDAMWVLGSFTPEELLLRLKYLAPTAEPRQAFSYNSLMYTVAGCMAHAATGQPWAELVRKRILTPLGMAETVCEPAALTAAADHATGYLPLPGAPGAAPTLAPSAIGAIPTIAPAGAICSNINDMGKWLAFQLGDGTWQGQRLVSAQNLLATHTQQIAIGVPPLDPRSPMIGYGMGWYVSVYRGHYVCEHDGLMNGAQARVLLLPRDGCGVIVLANQVNSPAPELVTMAVVDRLLGFEQQDRNAEALAQRDAARDQAGAASAETAAPVPALDAPGASCVGVYEHPAYGRIQISATTGGRLMVQVNQLPAIPLLAVPDSGQPAEAGLALQPDPGELRLAYARLLLSSSSMQIVRSAGGAIAGLSFTAEPAIGAVLFTKTS